MTTTAEVDCQPSTSADRRGRVDADRGSRNVVGRRRSAWSDPTAPVSTTDGLLDALTVSPARRTRVDSTTVFDNRAVAVCAVMKEVRMGRNSTATLRLQPPERGCVVAAGVVGDRAAPRARGAGRERRGGRLVGRVRKMLLRGSRSRLAPPGAPGPTPRWTSTPRDRTALSGQVHHPLSRASPPRAGVSPAACPRSRRRRRRRVRPASRWGRPTTPAPTTGCSRRRPSTTPHSCGRTWPSDRTRAGKHDSVDAEGAIAAVSDVSPGTEHRTTHRWTSG